MTITCKIALSGNLTKIDDRRNTHASRCAIYAVMKESTGNAETICGEKIRFKHVYATTSYSLAVRIVDPTEEEGHTPNFVIEYQGNVRQLRNFGSKYSISQNGKRTFVW